MYNSQNTSEFDVEIMTANGTDLNASTSPPQYTDDEIMAQINNALFPLKYYQWIFIITFCIIFVIGIGGNFLVCYSVWRCKDLKSVTNLFLVNLAVADFLVIFTCLPANLVYENLNTWFLGNAMCKLIVYMQRVSLYVSVLTLTAISIERYLAICYPFGRHTTSLKTKLAIVLIWIISLATPCNDFRNIAITPHGQVPDSLQPWLTQCKPIDASVEMKFQIVDMTLFYVLPLCIMAFTYSRIAFCLWSSTRTGNAATHNLHHEAGVEQLRARKRTAKMLIVVVITFGIVYLPINIINIIRYTGALDSVTDRRDHYILYQMIRFFMYFNSAINPVIYNFMSAKFRKQFKSACFGCYSCFFKTPIDSAIGVYLGLRHARSSNSLATGKSMARRSELLPFGTPLINSGPICIQVTVDQHTVSFREPTTFDLPY